MKKSGVFTVSLDFERMWGVHDVDASTYADNIDGVDVLPSAGANVYDILRRDTLVLTKSGVQALEARLK